MATASRTSRAPRVQNVILDLDETLISAVECAVLRNQPAKLKEFQERSKLFKVHAMDNDYWITERPGVQSFLDFVFRHFNVSVWTAASKDYALFVVEKVILRKPNRKLDYFLFSDHCDVSHDKTGCLKQLNQLFHFPRYNPQNTVIVDDNRNVSENQDNLVLSIRPFRFFAKQSETDRQLEGIQEKLRKLGHLQKNADTKKTSLNKS